MKFAVNMQERTYMFIYLFYQIPFITFAQEEANVFFSTLLNLENGSSDLAQIKKRCSKTDAGCPRTLEYYGGARGQYLLVYPDGRMYITGKRRAPGEDEDVGTAPEDPSDSVAINQPPPNASVAEAKPVSVAIAGEGGVASAAPVAQAIVGPQGLAISRPVATAVAGVQGQEELIATILGQGKTHGYAYSIFHPNSIQRNAVPIIYYPIVY